MKETPKNIGNCQCNCHYADGIGTRYACRHCRPDLYDDLGNKKSLQGNKGER